MNTGAEAVETAIKAARKLGALHGQGSAERSGGDPGLQRQLPRPDDDHRRLFLRGGLPSRLRPIHTRIPESRPTATPHAVAEAMNPNVAAILVEPIQGVGRHRDQYHRLDSSSDCARLRTSTARCWLLTRSSQGSARTGAFFAYEHEGVRPDIVIIGKALSGGMYPVSAILADDGVMGVFKPGEHGSTYGGNPLGVAIAREALAGAGGRESGGAFRRALVASSWTSWAPSTRPTSS